MSRRKLTIDLPQPCEEPWEAMEPVAGGRHCESCAKTVVDLSNCSDAQLIEFFSRKNAAGACCRLRGDQLNRTMQEPAPRSPGTILWQRAAAVLLAIQVLVTESVAQTTRRTHQTTVRTNRKAHPAQPRLKGRVFGMDGQCRAWTFGPITLQIGDTGVVHVTPDSNFRFDVPLPPAFREGTIRWAMQDVYTGVILDDSVHVNAAHPDTVIALHWQSPEFMQPATVTETHYQRSYGGAPLVQFEPTARSSKRSVWHRMFGNRSKRYR